VFDNSFTFTYDHDDDRLLVGKAVVLHDNLEQDYTRLGWIMTDDEQHKTFTIFYDDAGLGYFNPIKQEVSNAK
jgi:hypothetical protein